MEIGEEVCVGINEIEQCMSYEIFLWAILFDCLFYLCVILISYSVIQKIKEKLFKRKNRKGRNPKI
tara:strand:- start:106 stop:303 length:198 start_codon:yes stop_codon:yes gene_type:complete